MKVPYTPVNDTSSKDSLYSAEPTELMKSGNFNKVPIMIGACSQEGIFINIRRFLIIDSSIYLLSTKMFTYGRIIKSKLLDYNTISCLSPISSENWAQQLSSLPY